MDKKWFYIPAAALPSRPRAPHSRTHNLPVNRKQLAYFFGGSFLCVQRHIQKKNRFCVPRIVLGLKLGGGFFLLLLPQQRNDAEKFYRDHILNVYSIIILINQNTNIVTSSKFVRFRWLCSLPRLRHSSPASEYLRVVSYRTNRSRKSKLSPFLCVCTCIRFYSSTNLSSNTYLIAPNISFPFTHLCSVVKIAKGPRSFFFPTPSPIRSPTYLFHVEIL